MTLTRPPKDGWKQGVGRIDSLCLKSICGTAVDRRKMLVLVCGPPGLCDNVKAWCNEMELDLKNDLVVF